MRRLLIEFVRWLVNRWASGRIEEEQKKEDWDEQSDSFKDAADKWRKKR